MKIILLVQVLEEVIDQQTMSLTMMTIFVQITEKTFDKRIIIIQTITMFTLEKVEQTVAVIQR